MPNTNPLADQVFNAVVHNPHVDPRTMHIEMAGSSVTLKGTAATFFEKQMAQEAIRKVDGVQLIDNCLEVIWNELAYDVN